MAEIIYCDGCGKRIREGEAKFAVDAKSLCAACHGATKPASTAANPIPADISKRETVLTKSSSQKIITRETPNSTKRMAGSSRASDANARPLPAPETSQKKTAIIIAAGVLLLCGGLAVALSGGKSDRTAGTPKAAEQAKPVENKAKAPMPAPVSNDAHLTSTAQPVKPVEPAKPAEKEPSMDDIREGYARRTLKELIDKDNAKTITLANYRKALTSLVASHGTTMAGQEAKTLLADLPPAEAAELETPKAKHTDRAPKTPANTPANTPSGESKELFHWKGAAGADNPWKAGSKEEKVVSAGKAWSWKSSAVDSNWISTKMAISIGDIVLPKDGWLRLHIKGEGVNTLMFHSGVGDMILENFKYGFKPGDWVWVTCKFADSKKNIRSREAPPSWDNERYSGSTIFGHAEGQTANLWIDEVIVGTGPIPEE